MAKLTRDAVMEALGTVMDPDLGRDLVTLGMVRDVEVQGSKVRARVVLTTPACPLKAKMHDDAVAALEAIGAEAPEITMDAEMKRNPSRGAGPHARDLGDIAAVVAVASGEGGVGKSTVAVNLAVALAQTGAKVGLLDADIYGPSMAVMLGLRDARPMVNDNDRIQPIERHGIKVISMGFLLKDDDAVVWRGPMLGKALEQFLFDVDWGTLDYLIIDLPPGTGDVQLNLVQQVALAGAVVVTTPQDVAFSDVRRAIKMFEMTNARVLGIVENMSYFVCDGCGKEHHLFGPSRTADRARELGLPSLGSLPLDGVTSGASDRGEPIVLAAPEAAISESFREVAGAVAQQVAIATVGADAPGAKFANFFAMKDKG